MHGERDCRVETVCTGREIAGLRVFAEGERLQGRGDLRGDRDCRVERVFRRREIAGSRESVGEERLQGR